MTAISFTQNATLPQADHTMPSLPTIQCYLYPHCNAISTHNAMASYAQAKVNCDTRRVPAEGCLYYVIFTYDKLCTLNWVYI